MRTPPIAHPATPRAALRVVAPALLALLALALSAGAARADTPSAGAVYHDGPSGRYLVDGTWHRRSDPKDRGRKRAFQRQTSLAGWRETTVPDAANAGDDSVKSYLGSVWWYRRDFEAPSAAAGTTWILRFESVNYRATVWLNGHRIGSHEGGYLPFEVKARGIRRRGTNRLVVRVDSRRQALDVPPLAVRNSGRFVGGWWNYGGILREVYLRRVDALDLANVEVRPILRDGNRSATLRVRAIVANYDSAPVSATVTGRVAGSQIPFSRALVPAGGFHIFRGSVTIQRPRLWSPSKPSLYRVGLGLERDGDEVQRYSVHTGVRSFDVDRKGRMLLNGKPVTLRGASLHEDNPERGAALRPADIRADVSLLRDLGADMTRAHYPLHPLTLELADRYGILVWSEVPVYQMAEGLFRRSKVRRQSLAMVRDMVNRDRNHASVAVWSLGNENATRPAAGFSTYLRAGARLARQLDPTRLVGLGVPGYPTVGRQEAYARLDALGVNDYFGWYDGPGGSVAHRDDLGPYLERMHDDYGRQALFVTEFGAEADRSGPVTEKGTYEFQRDFLAYHLGVIGRKPFINGALVWILRDFKVKPGYDGGNPKPLPPYNAKGLVGADGAKKPAFDDVRRLFAPAKRD